MRFLPIFCQVRSLNYGKLKPIIKELCHIDKLTREHIYSAHTFPYNLLDKDIAEQDTHDANNG